MINASEAKEQSESSKELFLDTELIRIGKEIEKASSRGRFYIVTSFDDQHINELISKIESKGYNVCLDSIDPRDHVSSYKISW